MNLSEFAKLSPTIRENEPKTFILTYFRGSKLLKLQDQHLVIGVIDGGAFCVEDTRIADDSTNIINQEKIAKDEQAIYKELKKVCTDMLPMLKTFKQFFSNPSKRMDNVIGTFTNYIYVRIDGVDYKIPGNVNYITTEDGEEFSVNDLYTKLSDGIFNTLGVKPYKDENFALHYCNGTTWGDVALVITVTEDGLTVIDNRPEEYLETEKSRGVTEDPKSKINQVKQMIHEYLSSIKDIQSAKDEVRRTRNEKEFKRERAKIPNYIFNNLFISMYGKTYTLDGWIKNEELRGQEIPERDTFYKILSELYSILNIRDYKREDEIGKVTTADVTAVVADVNQGNMTAANESIKEDLEPKDQTPETPAPEAQEQ